MSNWNFKVVDQKTRLFVRFDDDFQPYEYYVRGTCEGFEDVIGYGHNLDDAFDRAHLEARLAGIARV